MNKCLFLIIALMLLSLSHTSFAEDISRDEKPPELVNAFELVQSGNVDESIKICNDYLAIQGENAYAYSCLGYAYNEKGEYLDAIDALDKSLILKPGYEFARIQLGIANMELGNYKVSEKIFLKLMGEVPDWHQTYYFLGNLMEMQKRNSEAIQLYSKAIAIEPEFIDALLARGKLYAELDRHDDAIKDFSDIIKIAPDMTKAYIYRLDSYGANEEWNLAINDCDTLIELEPENVYHYIKRSSSSALLHEYGKAINDSKTALKLPGCPKFVYFMLILQYLNEWFLAVLILLIILIVSLTKRLMVKYRTKVK